MTALAGVRAAQQRDGEAEEHLPAAQSGLRESRNYKLYEQHPLERLVDFLQSRGRDDDAAVYEARLAELESPRPESTARIA